MKIAGNTASSQSQSTAAAAAKTIAALVAPASAIRELGGALRVRTTPIASTRDDERRDQDQADDAELRERLREQRVGVAHELARPRLARPPELEAAGADPGQRLGASGVDRRLPERVAALARRVEDLLKAGGAALVDLRRAAEVVPAGLDLSRSGVARATTTSAARASGRRADREARRRARARPDGEPWRESRPMPACIERDAGADDEDDRGHLVALRERRRAGLAGVERLALLERRDHDRGAAERDERRAERREPVGREDQIRGDRDQRQRDEQ